MTQIPVSVPISVIDRLTGPMRQMLRPADAMAVRMRRMKGDMDRLGSNRAAIDMFGRLKKATAANAAALTQAQRKVAELGRQMAATEKPTKSLTAQFARAQREASQMKQAQTAQIQKLHETRAGLSAAGISTRKLADETRRLDAAIEKATAGLGRQSSRMTTYERRTEQLAHARERLAGSRQRSMGLLGETAGVAAQGWAYGRMLQPAIEFEASMAKVGAVARATDAELAALTASARKLGRDTPWSASQAAEGMQYLSMAGFKVNEVVEAMPGMLDLASAGAIELADAADIASNILTGFGRQAGEMGYVGDVLTNTFTTSNTDLRMLGETMKYVAPIAAAAAVDIEQVAAMTGKLGDAGIQGSQAGTALRAMISRLQAPPKAAADALAELGVTTMDANGDLRDMFDVLRDLDRAMEGMGTATKGEMTAAIFGMEAASAATVLLDQAGSGSLQNYADSLGEVGSAARVAAKINETTSGSLKTLASRMESLSISVGALLLPAMVDLIDFTIPLIDRLTSWAEANPELVKSIAMIAGGLLALKVGLLATRIALQPLIAGFWMIRAVTAGVPLLFTRAAIALGVLAKGLGVVRAAAFSLARVLMANPIGLAIAAIAGGAYLIYRNWERVGPWFGRLFGNIEAMAGGVADFFGGIFLGDMSAVVDSLKRYWSGLVGFYQTVWAGITGVFSAAWSAIKPAIDGLFSISGVGAVWEAVQSAISAVLDALSAKFAAVWAVISPVIDALKWARDKGSEALTALNGGPSGEGAVTVKGQTLPSGGAGEFISDGVGGFKQVPARAQGGGFGPGPLLVGERGPEVRFESAAGFIANNGALRGMLAMMGRIRALMQSAGASVVSGAVTGAEPVSAMTPAGAGQARQINYAPHYNIVINGGDLSPAELRAMILQELRARDQQARADMRRLMHD